MKPPSGIDGIGVIFECPITFLELSSSVFTNTKDVGKVSQDASKLCNLIDTYKLLKLMNLHDIC